MDHDTARRRVTVAQQVASRTAFDRTELEPVLPVTAAASASGTMTVEHVETIASLMGSGVAKRICARYVAPDRLAALRDTGPHGGWRDDIAGVPESSSRAAGGARTYEGGAAGLVDGPSSPWRRGL